LALNKQIAHKRKVATLSDVARLAGVAPITVSRVINGEKSVRQSTRDKVSAAVDELNYLPNQAARRLAGAEVIRIGLLYSNPSANYLSEFLVGMLNKASLRHVHLVVEQCEAGADEAAKAQNLIANVIDGLILPPPLCDAPWLIEMISRASIPAVAVASGVPDKRVSAVSIDDTQAAYQMTRHLITLGHQRIGFIVGNPNQTASGLRLSGYETAMKESGLEIPAELVVQGTFSYRSGLDAAELLLRQDQRPTAIFASNDDMAAATVAVAHRLGLDVPGDLTVAGFDDAALATTIWPELTTVRQPINEMAGAAVDLLVEQIRSRRAGERAQPQHTLMDFSLIRRQSDAAPRARPPVRLVGQA
jgi:LacI family transcriptional regulator